MLKTEDIDGLISTLQAGKSGASSGSSKEQDAKIDAIIVQLQQLKDALPRQDDGLREQQLKRRIAAANALYASPYEFLAPSQVADPKQEEQRKQVLAQLGLDAGGSHGPDELARAHRRQMHANILAAIQDYMDLGERPVGDGKSKFADLLESREGLDAHFQRIHRENKIEAQIAVWDATRPDDPVTTPERAWLLAKLTKAKDLPPAPAKTRAAALDKAIKTSRGASKITEDLETTRRRLVVLREAFRLHGEDVSHPGTGELPGRLERAHANAMRGAIRGGSAAPDVTHYNTTGTPAEPIRGHDPRFTVDYDGSPDSVVGLYVTERASDEPDAVRGYRCVSKGAGTSFQRVEAGSLSRSDRQELERLIRVLVRGEDGRPSRIVSAGKHQRIMLWLDDRIADLRRRALDLPQSKYDRDHPDRFVKEIRALGKASRHVEEQLSQWEGQVTLLKDLYVHLMALPPTKASDAARYKSELSACLGPILTNRGFASRAQAELQAMIQAELKVEHPSPRALGEALIHCSTHPELPAKHEHHALQQALAGLSVDTAELWWAKAKLMVETELLELSYLTRMARGDLAVRPEVDWSEIARLVEQRIRAANGLICYVEDFEGAYAKIEKIITWLVGSLNNPESKIRKHYPAVGDAAISVSVGLTAGGSLLSFVKLGLSLAVQISGTVTQEDDRRLRFKGSISLGLQAKASADLLAASSVPSSVAFGDANAEHTAAEFDWLNMKMGVALSKGLASLSGAYVYAGPEHMAAAWAHRVAMFQTYVSAAVAWIPMPGLRNGRGTRRLQVLDPREVADDEAEMLKLVAGGDAGKLLEQLRKPILGTRSWRGPLHARDIGLAFDLQLPIPATTTTLHAENYRQKKLEIAFWRHGYASKQHTVDKWALRRAPGRPLESGAEIAMSPAIVRNWSKSYPPAVAFSLSATLSQVSTEDAGAGLFNVLPQLDPSKSSTAIASLGFSSDLCPAIDLTFIDIDNHPNPDNDGKYINIKAGRKNTLSAGTDLLGPSVGVSVAWTKGKTINPREAALVMEKLRSFPVGIPLDDGFASARSFVPDHFRSAEFMPALERLAEYGTFELNLVYSGSSRAPRWEIQYGRIWRGVDASLSVGIPVIPGLSVDVGGNLAMNRGRHEILGLETMTYVQTVYDGVTNRQRGAEYWAAYRTVHLPELLALCANVGRDGATSPYGHNNAHEEVRDDSEATPARSLTPGPAQQAQAAVKAKAKALLQACREPAYAPDLFGDEAGEWAELVDAATPKDKAKVVLAREVGNRIARRSTRALSLRVVDDVTYAQSQVWPSAAGKLPAEAADRPVRFFFVNPRHAHEIHCAVEQASNAAAIELEIIDPKGAVVWSQELRAEPVAAPAPPPEPPPPPPPDPGVASLEQLHADEPVDEARRTPSVAVIPPRSPITHTGKIRLEPGEAPLSLLTHAAGPYKVRLRLQPKPGVRSRRPATWAYVWSLQPDEIEAPLDEYLAAKKAWAVVQQRSAWDGGSHASALAAVFFEEEEAIEAPQLQVSEDGSEPSSVLADLPPPPEPPPAMPVVLAKGDGDCFFYGVAYWAELSEQDRGRYEVGSVDTKVGDAAGDREAMLRARAKVADHLASTLFVDVASHADLRRQPAPVPIHGFAGHDYVRRFKQQDQGPGEIAIARMLERADAEGEVLAGLMRDMILDLVRACPDGGAQWGDLMLLAPATAAAYGRPVHAYQTGDARYAVGTMPGDRAFAFVPDHGQHGMGLGGAPIKLLFNRRNHFDVFTGP